jgi:S-adenosylmethionine synthetase
MYPDKICDQVSDAILDACIKDDENSRVACGEFMNLRALVLCVGLVTYEAMHQ